MEKKSTTESRSSLGTYSERRVESVITTSGGVDYAALSSELKTYGRRLIELAEGDFMTKIRRVDSLSTYYSYHSAALETKSTMLGIEIYRLNALLSSFQEEIKVLTQQNAQIKANATIEIEGLKAKLAEKEAQLAKQIADNGENLKRFAREKADLINRISEKEAIEQELSGRVAGLSDELRIVRGNLNKSEDFAAGLQRKIVQMDESFNAHLKQLDIDHQNTLTQLENNHKKLIENVKIEITETIRREESRLRDRLTDDFRNQLAEKDREIGDFNRRLTESDGVGRNLQEENARLNKALSQYRENIEAKERHVIEAEDHYQILLEEAQRAAADAQAALQARLENETRAKLESLKAQYDVEIKMLRKKLIDQENTASYLTKEKAFADNTISDLRQNVERLKNELAEQKEYFTTEIETLTTQVDTYRTTFVDPKEFEIRFSAERAVFQKEILQLNNKIADLNIQINHLTESNRSLNQQAIDRLTELENYRERMKSAADGDEMEELRRTIANLQAENDQLHEKVLKISNEKNQQVAKVKGLESEIELLRAEIADLRTFIETKKKEIVELQESLDKLKKSNTNNFQDKNKAAGDLMNMSGQFETLKTNFSSVLKDRDHYKSAYENMHQEHMQTNQELLRRIKEMDELKKKYDDALMNLENKTVTTTTVKKIITNKTTKDDQEEFKSLN